MMEIIPRERAVDAIAGVLSTGDQWLLVTLHCDTVPVLARKLADVPGTTLYADNGLGLVPRSTDAREMLVTAILAPAGSMALIATVPKEVSAGELSELLDREAIDETQDVLLFAGPEGPLWWPSLFVDAIRRVDPVAAMHLEAHDVRRNS